MTTIGLRRLTFIGLVFGAVLGCREVLTAPDDPTEPPPPITPRPTVGLIEVTITGIGTPSPTASVTALAPEGLAVGTGPAGAAQAPMNGRTLSVMPGNGTIQFRRLGAQAIEVGTRGAGGQLYVSATFEVRNAQSNGTPHGSDRTNLTFLGVATASTLEGTAISRFNRFDGSPASAGLAAQFVPAGAVVLGGGGELESVTPDVLQVYHESEFASFVPPAAVTSVLPYGFVVRRAGSTTSRTLPAGPGADEFDGVVTFAFRVPLQPTATEDPYTIVGMFLAVDDAETWLTQSFEEAAAAAVTAAETRAASLGAQVRAFYADQVGSTPADRICIVRIADPDVSPSAYLADSLRVAAQSPNPFTGAGSFISRTASLAATFNYALAAATASGFAVHGSQSGRHFLGGGFTGGGTTTLATPAGAFRAGEEVEVSFTGGLSAETATARFCHGAVSRFRAAADPGDVTESAFRVGGAPRGMATSNLEFGDPNVDLVVANYDDGTVSVYLNSGGDIASPNQTLTTGNGPSAVALGDVSGDGAADLVVLNQLDNTLSIFLSAANPHNGSFNPAGTTVAVSAGTAWLAVANIDNTLGSDIVTVNDTGDPATSALKVRYSDGLGGFTTDSVLLGHRPIDVAVSDATLDGVPDIVLMVVPNPDKAGAVYTYSGGNLTGFLVDLGLVGPGAIAVGDVNGDFSPDLVAVNESGTISLVAGDGSGVTSTSTAETWSFDARAPQTRTGLTLAFLFDVNDHLDAVVANGETGDLSVVRYDGTDFVPEALSPAGMSMAGLLVDDLVDPFDDSAREIVVSLPDADEIMVLSVGTSGSATTPASKSFTLTDATGAAALGDVDGDDDLDLVAGGPSDAITVFLGNGAGNFASAGTVSLGGNQPAALTLADVNGDGDLDVVTVNGLTSNNASVLLGDGSGGFAAAPGSPFTTGTAPKHLAVGDVNGDGHLDLIAGNTGSEDVTVLLGDGTGGFSPAAGSPFDAGASGGLRAVALGDVNQDRFLDIVATNLDDAVILLGNGSGSFTPASGSPISLPWEPAAGGLALGDVDGDGALDVVVLSKTQEQAQVLLGDGSAGFAAATGSPFAAGSDPRHVAMGDTDGDGKLDLVVANPSSLSLMAGAGDGTFGAERRVHVAPGLSQLLLGDLQNTGRLDFVVTALNAVARVLSQTP